MRVPAHGVSQSPDDKAAGDWYCRSVGLETISENGEVDGSVGGPIEDVCADIFGERIERMKLAHIASDNAVAIELSEFVERNMPPRAIRPSIDGEASSTSPFLPLTSNGSSASSRPTRRTTEQARSVV